MIYLSGAVRKELIGMASVGYMLTPRTGNKVDLTLLPWAADNGCFAAPHLYSDDKYLAWLDKQDRSRCLFATAPDVLADWRATIDKSAPMLSRIRDLGYPVALIAQDGLPLDAVDWPAIDALFVGGTTDYKLSESAYALASEAQRQSKWCHMGRVNSFRRINAANGGGYDSVDGTFLAFAPDKNLAQLRDWLDRLSHQPTINGEIMTVTTRVSPDQRWTHGRTCPICGGREGAPRGKQMRCIGYMAEDGSAAFCSREESDTWSESAQCWVHVLNGRDLPPPVRVKRIKRDEIPEDAQPEPPSGKEPTAIYDYQDVDGSLLWQVLRFPLPGGKKTFKQRRPDGLDAAGNTRWRHNLEGVRMVPYRLPEIVETADDDLPVFVVEGEKDVETLRSLGLVATTNMGGAGKSWLDTYSEYLIGRTCYIIPDNDEDGRRHAKAVQRSLENATARAIIVSLGLIENKGDVTDWVDNGGTTDQLAKLCAVEDERYERARQRRNRVEQMTAAVLRNQEYEDVRWIIPGIMPEGTTLFAGKPKVGKSWLVLDMALAVARGGTLFDNTIPVQQGAVLYLALEDTFRRLKSRLLMLEKEAHPGDENLTIKIVSPSMQNGGLTYIEDFCQTHPDARLIVVDTLGVFRGPPGKGAGGYLEDYAIFQMLKPISDLYNVAFVLVTHTRKSGAGEDGDIFDAVLGSTAQTGGVDTIMVLDRDKDHNVTLHYKGRDVDEDKVRLVKDDDSGRWLLAPQDVRNPMSDARQEMVRILKDAGPLTPMQVVERTGGNPNTVRGTLKKMLASGQVEKVADCYWAKNDTKENGNVRNRPTPGLF